MTQQWKPISSAPKDGSEFLACYARQGNVKQIVKWNTLHGYFSSKGEPLPGFTTNATHWQPLPADPGTPPASAQDDAKDEAPAAWLLTNTRLGRTWASIVSPFPGEIDELNSQGITAEPLYRRPATAAGDARDAERLDWLEKKVVSKGMHGLSFDFVRHVEDGQVLERGVRIMWRHHLGERHPTIRAAIDEALAVSQQQEG